MPIENLLDGGGVSKQVAPNSSKLGGHLEAKLGEGEVS
jgi:hypothetical protein